MNKYLSGWKFWALSALGRVPSQWLRRLVLRRVFGADIGADAVVYGGFEIRAPRRLVIGAGSVIGHRVTLDARGGLVIGCNVNISGEAMIWTAQHDYRDPEFNAVFKPVTIEDHAWLGTRCMVLPGVTVGRGAVVAAGAVVTHDVPPCTVVAGIPAREVARRPDDFRYAANKDALAVV